MLESLYLESTLQATLDEIRLINTPIPNATSDSATIEEQQATPGQLDTLAYIADLRDRLIEVEPVVSDADDDGWLELPFGLTAK